MTACHGTGSRSGGVVAAVAEGGEEPGMVGHPGGDSSSGRPWRMPTSSQWRNQVREIARTKLPELDTTSLEATERIVAGTARSMGIEMVDPDRGRGPALRAGRVRPARGVRCRSGWRWRRRPRPGRGW
jgi:hypothetical protein